MSPAASRTAHPAPTRLDSKHKQAEVMTARSRDEACVLCPEQLTASNSPFDSVLAVGPNVRLIPALGMMLPGYFLVCSDQHVLSMASHASQGLGPIEVWVRSTVNRLAPVFGEYIVFEHGSCPGNTAGSCISHAHLHLIPALGRIGAAVHASLDWDQLVDFESIGSLRGTSYAYFSDSIHHYVAPSPQIRSQWVRRLLATKMKIDTWDWAVEDGYKNLEITLDKIPDDLPTAVPVGAA